MANVVCLNWMGGKEIEVDETSAAPVLLGGSVVGNSYPASAAVPRCHALPLPTDVAAAPSTSSRNKKIWWTRATVGCASGWQAKLTSRSVEVPGPE